MFSWKFVSQKVCSFNYFFRVILIFQNILFIFAEHDFQDFALKFDKEKSCVRICDILIKRGVSF